MGERWVSVRRLFRNRKKPGGLRLPFALILRDLRGSDLSVLFGDQTIVFAIAGAEAVEDFV